MRRTALLLCLAGLPLSTAADELDAVRDLTVREYQEIDLFTRSSIMEPIAEREGISYDDLNACLIASSKHPVFQRETVAEAVTGCVEWAKSKD